MQSQVWIDLYPLNELQTKIMRLVSSWAKKEKTPIPHRLVIKKMLEDGVKEYTTANALKVLVKTGYVRRGTERSNKTVYVQLKTIR
jgi:hypothetical protein